MNPIFKFLRNNPGVWRLSRIATLTGNSLSDLVHFALQGWRAGSFQLHWYNNEQTVSLKQ